MEIAPEIFFIPNPITGPAGSHEANVFVVGRSEAALVDAGSGEQEAVDRKLAYLQSAGISGVAYIVVTHAHADHSGGAARLKAATGAAIVVHRGDLAAMNNAIAPEVVDHVVEEGDVLEAGGLHLEVVHTPGHAPGHICLFLRERRALFTGDHVVGRGTTAISPPQGDMAAYVHSLRKLLVYDAEVLCPGHGPVVRTPRQKVEELIEHRLDRERQVLGLLERGLNTIDELRLEIYPELEARLANAARGQMLAHLTKLVDEGRVRRTGSAEQPRFELA